MPSLFVRFVLVSLVASALAPILAAQPSEKRYAQGTEVPDSVRCTVSLKGEAVQFRPWVFQCAVTSPASVPLKIFDAEMLWSVREGAAWGNRTEWVCELAGRTQMTCWPIAAHGATPMGQQNRSEFEYVFSPGFAIAWPGRYRVLLAAPIAWGDGALDVEDGISGASRIRIVRSEWLEFDVTPAGSPEREALEASRATNGILWQQYIRVLCSAVRPRLERGPLAPPPPPAVLAAVERMGPPPCAPIGAEILQIAPRLGPEFHLLALLRTAARLQARSRAEPASSVGLLTEAAERLSVASACGAGEERRLAAVFMHHFVRVDLGPPALVDQLRAEIVGSPALPQARRHLWFHADVRASLGL